MVWDVVGFFLLATVAVTGWNLGLRNSWPVPIAIVLATVLSQLVYVPVCAWASQQLEMPVGLAIFVGYCLVWFGVEIACEGTMLAFGSLRRQHQQTKLEKATGAGLALTKGVVVVVFASLAGLSNQTISGPHEYSGVGSWLTDDSRH